jgi:hypothetical protein
MRYKKGEKVTIIKPTCRDYNDEGDYYLQDEFGDPVPSTTLTVVEYDLLAGVDWKVTIEQVQPDEGYTYVAYIQGSCIEFNDKMIDHAVSEDKFGMLTVAQYICETHQLTYEDHTCEIKDDKLVLSVQGRPIKPLKTITVDLNFKTDITETESEQ